MRFRCRISEQGLELLYHYTMWRRLFARVNGNHSYEQLRAAAANLRNLIEGKVQTKYPISELILILTFLAQALLDGNYSQYENSNGSIVPQLLHSTPSREDLSPKEEQPNLQKCEHCGNVYRVPEHTREVTLFDNEPTPSLSSSASATCEFCHTQLLFGSEIVDVSQYEDAEEEMVCISALRKEADGFDDSKTPPKTNVRLSLDFEIGSDGSIKNITANGPQAGRKLNISMSDPQSSRLSTAAMQCKISTTTNQKSTQTQNQKSFFQFVQQSFIRRQRLPADSYASQFNTVWNSITRQQERLLTSFDALIAAFLELVDLCEASNVMLVVKPYWGYGSFAPTSCFFQFGSPTAVNLHFTMLDRIKGTTGEEFVAALSLVRCALNQRRSDLLKVFRVEFNSDLMTLEDDVDRVLKEVCEVFGVSVFADRLSR